MGASEPLIKVDGSQDFSGGVDSIKVTTVQSQSNPNGLGRNQQAWLVNATVRDGGITPRFGWQPKGVIHDGSALFQDISVYEPDFGPPYLIALIGGRFYKIDPDFGIGVQDLSATFGITNPATTELAYMVQAEEFLITQAGDYGLVPTPTLPVFWDGNSLRRSVGLSGGPPAELPAATAMDYYQGRVWYAQGRLISAGDIVRDQASGTLPYSFRDSVLRVTENPLAVSGDGFTVPSNAGNIRAIKHSANLDATLGQGNLFIGTTRSIYSLSVPITRADWIAATANNQPLMTVVQINNGMVNDRSVVAVNGDLYFQSLEPSVRSLLSALRYFGQPGNTQISANEERILQFNDRSLMRHATGIQFDNRLLQAVLPRQTPQGVIHQAILPLDFTPVSSFGKVLQPVWEGHYEGLQILKLISGDFGGLERAFAVVVSDIDSSIQLWELTNGQRFDQQDLNGNGRRVTWQIEFPAFNWEKPFDLKKMVSAEIWVDKLYGDVDFTLEYRPDGDVCWNLWQKWKECVPKNSCDPLIDAIQQVCYPLTTYRESFRSTMTLPRPPEKCQTTSGRPAYIAYQIQPRLTIKGWCRVRGLLLHGENFERALYNNMVCSRRNKTPYFPPAPAPAPSDTGQVFGNPVTQEVFGDASGDEFGVGP